MERIFQNWEYQHGYQYKGERIFPGFLRLARPYIRASQRILDVGAGGGAIVRNIKERYPHKEIVGIDPNPGADDVLKMDIRSLEFPDGCFDLVISTDVLEHLPDAVLNAGLREIARVSRPGGYQVFNTINEEILEESLCRCPDCGKVFHKVEHVQRFTVEELKGKMQEVGLVVESAITWHMGGYTLFPRLFRLFKLLRLDRMAPPDVRRLFNKDLYMVCRKKAAVQ